jgi:hypothetical protein
MSIGSIASTIRGIANTRLTLTVQGAAIKVGSLADLQIRDTEIVVSAVVVVVTSNVA